MKKFTFFAALILATLANPAEARSLHPGTYIRVSELTSIDLNREQFGSRKIDQAFAEVDKVQRTVTLRLREVVPLCPQPKPGMMTCMAVGTRLEETTISLPIKKIARDACGSTIYFAEKDQRPVDGLFQSLELLDHSTMTCEIAIHEEHMTELTYIAETPGFGAIARRFESRFSGRVLRVPTSGSPL